MKLLKHILIVALLISVAACSVNEENFPIDLEAVLNNNGAYLRVIEVESAGFDILDLDNAEFTFRGEVFDKEEGALVESVDFYINYRSAADGGPTVPETAEPFKTFTASDFTVGGSRNLPQATFRITIDEALAAVGIQQDDLLIGDRFQVRWTINLEDGRSFSVDDASPDITGGAFFSSPYFANVFVVAAIPQDQFVGDYTFFQQQASGSVAGAFANGWIFNGAQEFTATISVDPDNTLNGRIFTATPLAEFGVGSQDYRFTIALANDPEDNTATLVSNVGTGLACSAIGIAYGAGQSNKGTFELADDSEFELVVSDNVNGDCGLDPDEIAFTVTAN